MIQNASIANGLILNLERKKTMLRKFFICFVAFSSSLLAQNVDSNDLLWRILFKEFHFGYTIFGSKPMCSQLSFVNNCRYTNVCSETDFMLNNLWEKWEKNYVLSSKYFCMKKVRYCELENEWEEFYIINKTHCLAIIKSNFYDFKSCFKNLNSPNEILEEICNNGSHGIKDQRLIGLLYGYGDFNASKFKERSDYFDQLAAYIGLQNKKNISKLKFNELGDMLYARKQSIFMPKKNWNKLLKRYRKLSAKFISANSLIPHSELLAIPFPCFVITEKNKETIELIEEFKQTEIKLNEIYYSNKFLDLILEKTEFQKSKHPVE